MYFCFVIAFIYLIDIFNYVFITVLSNLRGAISLTLCVYDGILISFILYSFIYCHCNYFLSCLRWKQNKSESESEPNWVPKAP